MKTNLMVVTMATALAVVAAACGGETRGGAAQRDASVADATPSGTCGLLSREQVNAVVPGNDGGTERDASEAALLKDVEMAHCRYFHLEGSTPTWLDLLLYRASSEDAFEQINIGKWAHQGTSRELDIGDIGFLHDLAENEIQATASKGWTVFELTLHAEDAHARSEPLIAPARVVAEEVFR